VADAEAKFARLGSAPVSPDISIASAATVQFVSAALQVVHSGAMADAEGVRVAGLRAGVLEDQLADLVPCHIQVVYSGAVADAEAHFARLGYAPASPDISIADHMLDVAIKSPAAEVGQLVAEFQG